MLASVSRRSVNKAAVEHADLRRMARGDEGMQAEEKEQLVMQKRTAARCLRITKRASSEPC